MKRKGCCGASVSSPRKREGLEYRAQWSLIGRGKKVGGAGNELWWKDCGSDGRKIREFSYDGYSFFHEVSEIDIP